ncbi:bone morphogenetic protein 1 homolog [Glandiceps talaboti]
MTDSEHWELSSFPECGQTITTEAAGLLASSRWQDNIASSTKWCKYTITNSQPDGHINLEFPYVRVHSAAGDSSDLSEEKVIIYDGPTSSSKVLGVYCLKTLPKSLISSSNTVAIEYLAPSQEVGFVIAYSMNFGEQVRYLQYPATGEVKSPGYPDNYLDSREYVWSFTAPSDQKVVLEFNDFDLEYGTDCDYDFVEVYDGVEMTSSNLIGRYCGQSLPDIIESTSKDLSMKFVSDHAVNSKGFSAFFHYEAEQTESSTEDPCQAEKDEINEVKAHRGALYITTIVFGSVGFVMIVMLSASIYLISGREVKLRHYAGVSLTDPFLTELEPKKKKKKAKSKASDSFEEETDGNEEGATGGSDDVTSDGKDNKGLDIEVKVE